MKWYGGLFLALVCSSLLAQAPAKPKQQPAAPNLPPKQTFMVSMSDGVRLATDVYLPQGAGPFPIVLMRTPYDKSADRLLRQAAVGPTRGYAMVLQDTRGRFASEGKNLPFLGDGMAGHEDGDETVAWIRKQSWSNGKIGTDGGSALGIAQLLMEGDGQPDVECQHILVAPASMYHAFIFPGGIFKKNLCETWLTGQKFAPEALPEWVSHPNYDAYWEKRNLAGRYSKINVPAVHIAGYYDLFAQSSIDAFLGYNNEGGPRARGHQKLVIGPWPHSVLIDFSGEIKYPGAAHPPSNVHDSWRWFDYYLKGISNGIDQVAAVSYFVMGDVDDPTAPGKKWRTASTWPPLPFTATEFFLTEKKEVTKNVSAQPGKLSYDYDPKNPALTLGGAQLTLPGGTKDQRTNEMRPDVLVFTSEPLTEPMEITGSPQANLWISSSAPDTDFFVKICDVLPDGRSINLSEGQLRTRFRSGFAKPELMKPGNTYSLRIPLSPTSIILNKGHRLRVDVTSSSFPGFDPNPNTGEDFRASEKAVVAKNRIVVGGNQASRVILPIVKSSP